MIGTIVENGVEVLLEAPWETVLIADLAVIVPAGVNVGVAGAEGVGAVVDVLLREASGIPVGYEAAVVDSIAVGVKVDISEVRICQSSLGVDNI